MSMTEQFHAVFSEVDVNHDSIIDERDLRNYATKKGLKEENFVKKWLTLFDDDNDGIIHEEDFRVKLGMLPAPQEESIQVTTTKTQKSGRARKFRNAPRVVKADMRDDLQEKLLEEIVKHSGDKISKDMKVWDLEHHLGEKFPPGEWLIKLNPAQAEVDRCNYDPDGLLHVAFLDEEVEMLIWRKEPKKGKGGPLCCFCC